MAMFAGAYFFFSLIGLSVATFTDIKNRIVSDKLTLSLAVLGLFLKALESFTAQSLEPLLYSIAAAAIAFAFAYLLWRLGVWAGGDVKLITALAFLNPVNYNFLGQALAADTGIFTSISLPIFPITLTLYSAMMVFPMGIMMSVSAGIKHREVLKKAFKKTFEKGKSLIGFALLVSGLKLLLAFFSVQDFYILPALIALAFLPKKFRKYSVIIFTLAGIILSAQEFAVNSIVVALPLLLIYAFWNYYSESREYAFREKISTARLEEGMIPDRFVVERGNKTFFVEGPSMRKVIKQLMDNKLENAMHEFRIDGKVIAGPRQAGGLTVEQAEMLKALALKGEIPQKITVRKTMAFVPAILAAFILLQLTGDVLWNVVL